MTRGGQPKIMSPGSEWKRLSTPERMVIDKALRLLSDKHYKNHTTHTGDIATEQLRIAQAIDTLRGKVHDLP